MLYEFECPFLSKEGEWVKVLGNHLLLFGVTRCITLFKIGKNRPQFIVIKDSINT